MKHNVLILMISLACFQLNAQSTFTLDSTVLTSRTVISGIDIPWEITWGPDDFIWMTERYGRVSRVNPVTGQQQIILNISSQVYDQSESGLLGMALHPDFANNPYVYLVYTYLSGSNILEKLVRYTYDGNNLVSPLILLDNIAGNTTHIGSRLYILPDNTMLMTTGDAQNQSSPQNTSSLVGKVLRMNLDGSVPSDNPITNSLVWSYGHRNPQGIWRAPNGVIYVSEHGPTTDDELSILMPNGNYGWPNVTGYCDSPPEMGFCTTNNVVEPLVAWTPTIAPSDIIWYNHPAIPEFKDKLLITVLKDKELKAFGFNPAGDSVVSQSTYLENRFGRLRDICISPTGKIYIATNGASWSNTNPFTHSIIELSNNSFVSSVLETKEPLNIKIWPNPIAEGHTLHIELPDGMIGEIAIFDLLGRQVTSKQLNGSEAFPITLPGGLYFWRINPEGTRYSHSEGTIIVR